MSTGGDDDALSWDGDDDPTLTTGRDVAGSRSTQHPPAPPRPAPRRAPASAEDGEPRADDLDDESAPGLGNAALVAIGMIAAAFILFAVGWFIAGMRLQALGTLPVSAATLLVMTIAASAAPLVWFATVYAVTRHARTWVRFAWLVAGLVLLVPWPFVVTGAFA